MKADLQKVPKKTLIKICVLQLKISIFTSKFIFNFFTYYLFLFLSVFFKNKFEELHHPKYKYFNKDSTIYDNPPVLRKLPKELFFQFNDLLEKRLKAVYLVYL